MKKIVICISLLSLFVSCNNNEQKEHTSVDATKNAEEVKKGDNVASAQKWLVETIEGFFTNFETLKGDYSTICTKEYAEFKKDATNVDMDGGMSEDAFKTKWGRRYSEYAGIQEGFLIGGTDNGKIKVSKCELKNKTEMGGYLFEVVLEDEDYKSTFYREIVVVPSQNSFLIDDVREIKNVFAKE